MAKLSLMLFATALSALVFSTVTVTTYAADQADSIKTSRPPYKPGREIESDASPEGSSAAPSSGDAAQQVKPSHPPYKPGRQADEK